jgi:hypothetical protein
MQNEAAHSWIQSEQAYRIMFRYATAMKTFLAVRSPPRATKVENVAKETNKGVMKIIALNIM